jgi:CheY-specific phosphatase CheX
MSIKFFGQHLIERGIISTGQLHQAIEHQKTNNLKFGEWAVKRNWLDDHYVERLLNAQKRIDMKIGDLAVHFRMLEPDDVKKILNMQKNNNIMIGEVIVELGHVSADKLDEELALFLQDQQPFIPEEVPVPKNFTNADALRHIADLTRKFLRRIGSMEAKIDGWSPCAKEPEQQFSLVSVHIVGDVNCEYALSVSKDVAAQLASGMLNTNVENEPDEILMESAKEFCNLVCGNFRSMMKHSGKILEISYPIELQFADGYQLIRGRTAVSCGVSVNEGQISMFLIDTVQHSLKN